MVSCISNKQQQIQQGIQDMDCDQKLDVLNTLDQYYEQEFERLLKMHPELRITHSDLIYTLHKEQEHMNRIKQTLLRLET